MKASGVACPNSDRLPERIERLLLTSGFFPPDRLEVSVEQQSAGLLRVRLTRTSEPGAYERLLPISADDCDGLPYAVAAIIRGWLRPSWEDVAERVADIDPPQAVESASSPSAFTPTIEGGARPYALRPQARRWRLAVAGGGFAALGASAQAGPSLSASGEWDRAPRWGLALQAGLDGARESPLGPGTIDVRLWQVAALARVSLLPTDSTRLDLLAGPSLQVLDAGLSGFAVQGRLRAAHPAAMLALRWRQRLAAPVELVATICASARRGEEVFYVREPRVEFAVPAGRAAALIGLAWVLE